MTRITVDRDAAMRYFGPEGDERPDMNMAEIAELSGVCPTGLLVPWTLSAIRVESDSDRLSSPAYAGGAQDTPSALLEAKAVIANRRGLHQRREMDRLQRKHEREARHV